MVLANVAAAEELERLHQPCMYPRPRTAVGQESLEALRGFLHTLGITLPPADKLHPRDLDHVFAPGCRHAGGAAGQRGDAAVAVAGGVQPGQYRSFRSRLARATHTSPARSAAMPTCWYTAR